METDFFNDDFFSVSDGNEKMLKASETVALKLKLKNEYRRAASEIKLLDMDFDFEEGDSYHFMTAGDVDALSFLSLILRQQKIKELYMSTWVAAQNDVDYLEKKIKDGRIGILKSFVGEIFKKQYPSVYNSLSKISEVKSAKNHSKIWAGRGEKFDFHIEMSCNINTNPRIENACIVIGGDGFEFYKQFFDGLRANW